MKIVSVVPIKLNNERLPGKNTKELGGRPLIQYILDTLLQEERINDRYVYCSDKRVRDFLPEGIEFLERPSVLDESAANFTQIFDCFCKSWSAAIQLSVFPEPNGDTDLPYIHQKSERNPSFRKISCYLLSHLSSLT